MKNIYLLISALFLVSCISNNHSITYFLSPGIENIKVFPANKKDSAKIREIDSSIEKSLEKCKQEKNKECIDDRDIMTIYAKFPKGISNFRMVLFNKFKLSKNATTGENRILVTIGTENKLENIEILKYTDQETRKSIETAFKLKELNTWESANIYGIPVKEKFEISIFIENKKITHY